MARAEMWCFAARGQNLNELLLLLAEAELEQRDRDYPLG